jgi:micrococcal nuclease
LVLLCVNASAFGEEFFARVIVVLDGDTVLIRRSNGLVKIRLAGIDAPEKEQAYGADSKRSLSDMVMGRQVKIASEATDQYGRMVAHLSINGLDVNAEQIRRGMAWEYSSYHSNKALIALQNEAKQVPRGLWAQSDPTPPWEWRKLHPSTQAGPAGDHSAAPGASCGSKTHCSEMSSCEEAKYYLAQCGVKSLDGNGDGVPCESLCEPRQEIKN